MLHCRMWLINKVELHWAKIGIVDCKWSNLNAQRSYTPWCHPFLGSYVGCPFLCAGKGKCCMWLVNKVEIHLTKIGFVEYKWSNLNAPRFIHPLVSSTFWVHYRVPFSLDAGKGKCCMWLVNNVEIKSSKICFADWQWSNLNCPVVSFTLESDVGQSFLCMQE